MGEHAYGSESSRMKPIPGFVIGYLSENDLDRFNLKKFYLLYYLFLLR